MALAVGRVTNPNDKSLTFLRCRESDELEFVARFTLRENDDGEPPRPSVPSFAFAHCPPPTFQLPHFHLLALSPSLRTLRLFFTLSSASLSRPSCTSQICYPTDFGSPMLHLSPFVAAQPFITLVASHLATLVAVRTLAAHATFFCCLALF